MYFKLDGLTSIDRYFLRKREIERSETGAKPLVRFQGRSPRRQRFVTPPPSATKLRRAAADVVSA